MYYRERDRENVYNLRRKIRVTGAFNSKIMCYGYNEARNQSKITSEKQSY